MAASGDRQDKGVIQIILMQWNIYVCVRTPIYTITIAYLIYGCVQATVTDPEARKEAMAALLQNETKALQSMQMLKMNAQRELHSEKTQQMLERMAQPHQWQVCIQS